LDFVTQNENIEVKYVNKLEESDILPFINKNLTMLVKDIPDEIASVYPEIKFKRLYDFLLEIG
jgi:hypothetical protein